MKSNSGITLTSLIIYVIGMVIVVSIISTLTAFFYKNIDIAGIDNTTSQYTKFSSIFLDEINRENNKVVECKTFLEDDNKISYIVFSSGNQYTFKSENCSVYRNRIKICENVEDCEFTCWFIDSDFRVKVDFKTKNIDMSGDNAIIYNL